MEVERSEGGEKNMKKMREERELVRYMRDERVFFFFFFYKY
jgi:hypothetical protein